MYATLEQLLAYLPSSGAEELTDDDPQTILLEGIIGRASRLIDTYTRRAIGFFDAASDTKTNRTFFGDGTNYLEVGKYIETISSADVSMPTGYTVPEFVAQDSFLIATYNGVIVNRYQSNHFLSQNNFWFRQYGWSEGVPITINAKWGWSAIPADITEACLQISVRWYRGRDESFSGVIGNINSDGQIIERDLPASAKLILDKYRVTDFVSV